MRELHQNILAAILDLKIYRGDAIIIDVLIINPNNHELPVDLTVYTDLVMQIKTDRVNTRWVLKLLPTGDVDGNLIITFTAADAKILTGDVYQYDVQGDDLVTVLEGRLFVEDDVTRI